MTKINTLEGVTDRYMLERVLRPDTIRTYRETVRRWIQETGINRLNAINYDEVLAWRNDALTRRRAITFNKHRTHLGALMNFAIERGWCSRNAFQEINPAPQAERLPKTVDIEVINAAIEFLVNPKNEVVPRLTPGWFWSCVIRTIFYTGLRRRQIAEMSWSDIRFGERVLLVRSETSKNLREWQLPLSEPTHADLELIRQETRSVRGRQPLPEEQVFNVNLFRRDRPNVVMGAAVVTNVFQRLSRELGQRISAHRLRHSMATALGPEGDIRTLQHILGHRSATTTMVYIHPDLKHTRRLLDQLPRLQRLQ